MNISKEKFHKAINKKGFYIFKNFYNKKQKKYLQFFSDSYAKSFIISWSKIYQNKFINKIDKESNLRHKIIKYYKIFGKPEYRRNPQKTLANKEFLEIISFKNFDEIKKLTNTRQWYFSFIKNLRFKSKLLPWSISKWHSDRLIYKNFKNSKMKFFTCWSPMQNVNKKTGGGLELLSKNDLSFDRIDNETFKKFNNKIYFLDKFLNKFKKKTYKPNLKFGDMLIFDSSVFHRTVNCKMEKPIWTMDFRFEYGEIIDSLSKKGGFKMSESKKNKLLKLKKSAKLNII